MFKKVFILAVFLGLLVGPKPCPAEVVGTESYYAWGFSYNGLSDMEKDNLFIQVNGEVGYKIKNRWVEDLYVGVGVNKDFNVAITSGYYLWKPHIGIQVGYYREKDNKDSDMVYGVWVTEGVLKYFWNNFTGLGNKIFADQPK